MTKNLLVYFFGNIYVENMNYGIYKNDIMNKYSNNVKLLHIKQSLVFFCFIVI